MKKALMALSTILLILCSCSSNNKNEDLKKLKAKIELGLDKEQQIRRQLTEKLDQGKFDSDLNKEMSLIDSINQIDMKSYLQEFEYPSYSRDGKKFTDAIFYIIQHSDTEVMEKYIDQLENRAFAGEASKKHYAMMKDRILVHNNQKQIYGTQQLPRKDSNGYITTEYFVWPIENVLSVDSLRKEMGFKKTVQEIANATETEFNVAEELNPDY